MKIQTARRYVLGAALAATFLLGPAFAIAQERRIQGGAELAIPVKAACPRAFTTTLNATTPYVFAGDFTPAMLAAPRSFLNDPSPNKSFLYTFRWASDQRCCEITSAVLTVRVKALQAAQTISDPTSGNDGIAIMHGGSSVVNFNQHVYTAPYAPPFNAGHTAVKTWPLSGQALNNLKANHRLSLYVQDDTTVQSATLQISGCCLSSSPRSDAVEAAQPARDEN